MIAETSVLFVSVKKVFDTTTLETRHHWHINVTPYYSVVLVKKLALFNVSEVNVSQKLS